MPTRDPMSILLPKPASGLPDLFRRFCAGVGKVFDIVLTPVRWAFELYFAAVQIVVAVVQRLTGRQPGRLRSF